MTKEPPSVLSALHTIGISLVTLLACCAVRWALEQYREARRVHNEDCRTCARHRRRAPGFTTTAQTPRVRPTKGEVVTMKRRTQHA